MAKQKGRENQICCHLLSSSQTRATSGNHSLLYQYTKGWFQMQSIVNFILYDNYLLAYVEYVQDMLI